MDEIRIGLAGLGHRGLHWLRTLDRMDGYRVTAICDWIEPLHATARDAMQDASDVTSFADYDEMIQSDVIDAVALCVRRLDQGALAAKTLRAGKHVSAEVPAAHTIDDCWDIVTAVEQTGNIYQLSEQTRYWGFIDDWRRLVSSGELGRITYCEGQYIGYYGTSQFFQDFKNRGDQYAIEELDDHPEAEPTVLHAMPPIHYLPHELSPMLKVLDDRVVRVVGMGTRSPSYSHPEIAQPDIQVALMKTAKDTVLRMAVGFTQPGPHDDHHWYNLLGTRGRAEWRRSPNDQGKLWSLDRDSDQMVNMDWSMARRDAPEEAAGSGHGDADYYVHATFRDALLHGKALPFDVYAAMDTAAPAILAADSIDGDSVPFDVPDFRPGPQRQPGCRPAE
jgi:predicted dehydrogenase